MHQKALISTHMKKVSKLPFIFTVTIILGLMLATGLYRLEIDSDVTHSLPKTDPVIADALKIFAHHPMQRQLAIDVGLESTNLPFLIACADFVEQELKASNLFVSVGLEHYAVLFPGIMIHAAENLPILLTAHDLEFRVKPLLNPDRVRERLTRP